MADTKSNHDSISSDNDFNARQHNMFGWVTRNVQMFMLEEIRLPPIESCHSESAHHHFHACQHKTCRKLRWSMEMQPWTKFVQLFQKATMVESTQELLMLNPKIPISFKYLSKFVKTLTCGFNPEPPWKGVNLLWSQTPWKGWASGRGSEFWVYMEFRG